MHSLRDLIVVELQDLQSGERLLWDSLRRMSESARDPGLARFFDRMRAETKAQIARLDTVLRAFGGEPSDDDCEAMEGIIAQAEELMEDDMPGEIMDAALVVTALKVKHFEIASYSALLALAVASDMPGAAQLLRMSHEEELRAEAELATVTTQDIHRKAARSAPVG